jgi:type I restriction enzyme S subunit
MKAETYVAHGIPVVRGNNIVNSRKPTGEFVFISEELAASMPGCILQPGDLVFPHRGAIGSVGLIDGDRFSRFMLSTSLMKLTPDTRRVDPLFVYYYFDSEIGRRELLMRASTVGTPGIGQPLSSLRSIPIPVPPLAVQQSIAATLGALDDKIESGRLLMQLALRLAGVHYLNAVRERPAAPYESAMTVRMGSAFKGSAFSRPEDGRPLLRIRDLRTFDSQVWTTESRSDETVIVPGDIVVGMDAEFRSTLWLGNDSVLNQRVCSFRPRAPVSRAFVLFALAPELALQERAKTGTTVIHLNKGDIDRFCVPALEDREHKALFDVTEPLLRTVVARAVENRTLTSLRDALIPELMSGRIHARDVVGTIA